MRQSPDHLVVKGRMAVRRSQVWKPNHCHLCRWDVMKYGSGGGGGEESRAVDVIYGVSYGAGLAHTHQPMMV